MAYYTAKGNAVRKGGSSLRGRIVKIPEAPDRVRPNGVWQEGRIYFEPACFMNRNDAGKLAVLFDQQADSETVRILAIPTITEGGMLRQLLMTEPSFYRFEPCPVTEPEP